MLVVGEAGLAPARVLCLGAHSDDIEIGAGGTILKLLASRPGIVVDWVVLAASGVREEEARASAARFLVNAAERTVVIRQFRERFFPQATTDLKEYFDELGRTLGPDLVICPTRADAHQDHRTVAELTASTFRDQLILEYEIPKYDGDLGRPSVFVHVDEATAQEKTRLLIEGFPTQRDRPWFTEETFRALMRLRGVESKAPRGYAEAFHCRKMVLA
ncbi:MAG: PIG-L deacetylase family protein [Candidatus Limnocylindria bacterium]